jgi:hypothetical protein
MLISQKVKEEENISRYLFFTPGEFNARTNHISPQAFKPANPKPPERPERQASVYRTQNLTEQEIWEIGDEFVAKKRNLPLLARADIQAKKIFEMELELAPDTRPHPRHANIVKWPDTPEARNMKGILLSQQAALLLRNSMDL